MKQIIDLTKSSNEEVADKAKSSLTSKGVIIPKSIRKKMEKSSTTIISPRTAVITHVPKGGVIEIGKGSKLKGLNKGDYSEEINNRRKAAKALKSNASKQVRQQNKGG